jgi:hypothetical protein
MTDGPDDEAANAGPDPAALVADADVLAADLFLDGDARAAMDAVRAHDWVTLVASDPLLDDAEAVIASLVGGGSDDGSGDYDDLASDWRETVESLATVVEHPPGDHPALSAAVRGNAAHVLSYDEGLQSAETAAALSGRADVSVKSPAAFARLFDPESLYPAVVGGEYPGPDRDPRE